MLFRIDQTGRSPGYGAPLVWKLIVLLIMAPQGGHPAQTVFTSEFKTERGCKQAEAALRSMGEAAGKAGMLQGARLFSSTRCVYDGENPLQAPDEKERL